MAQPDSLPAALDDAASRGVGKLTFHLEQGDRAMTSAGLAEIARARAAGLVSSGVHPGDRIGLLGPNRPEWAEWAYATWFAGATVVPLAFPLRLRDPDFNAEQLGNLVRAAGCRMVVHDPALASVVPEGMGLAWDERPHPETGLLPSVGSEDVAVIQFTSGSTASPKGVVLPHRAVLAEHRANAEAREIDGRDIGFGWLPFFHDWGLFQFLVMPMSLGFEGHVLPTERFAKDPAEWLRAVTRCGATFTGGPTTGIAAAVRAAARHPAGIDLGCLRMVIASAEIIEPETADAMIAGAVGLGMRPGVIIAGYGMAEMTLTVAGSPPGMGLSFDEVDLAELAGSGRALPAASGLRKRIACIGLPMPGTEIRVADESGETLPDRHIGEVLLRGPAMMNGYIGAGVSDPFVDGWLRSGDLGYLADGKLFITGRLKDVVLVLGHNYHPEDFEWAAGRVSGVRAGRCVAFGSREREGKVVVVVEPSEGADPDELPSRVRAALTDAVGSVQAEILVVAPGVVAKTTSGKLRRGAMRDAFERGELLPLVMT